MPHVMVFANTHLYLPCSICIVDHCITQAITIPSTTITSPSILASVIPCVTNRAIVLVTHSPSANFAAACLYIP